MAGHARTMSVLAPRCKDDDDDYSTMKIKTKVDSNVTSLLYMSFALGTGYVFHSAWTPRISLCFVV